MKPMTRALIEEKNVDDHHVFPDAYLKDEGVKETKRRECVLNRTLIDRTTNQSLSRRDPKSYFDEMRKKLGETNFNKLLESHLLPSGEEEPLLLNDYDNFLEWRCNQIGQAIGEATQNA
jgi:hypothetical protein